MYSVMLWDSSYGGAVRRAYYKLDYRSQILIERHMAACMDCRCVLPMRCRPTWEDLAAMFEGSTASGAERAYKKAVQKLTQLLIEDGLFHTIVLKRKRQKKRKEKIAAATYLYQADSGMQQTNIKKKLQNNQTYAMITTENIFISVTRKGENPCISTFHSISVKKL